MKRQKFIAQNLHTKFVDDLTILEVVNLVSVGISAYDFKFHVASDIRIDQNFITSENGSVEYAGYHDSHLRPLF